MNKTSTKLFLGLLASCLLLQCHQEPRPSSPSQDGTSDPMVVTAIDATRLAQGYQPDAASRTAASSTSPAKRIKNIRTWNDDEGNPLMHIIHFETDTLSEAGFIVIAGDKRVVPVLAKSEKGTFDPDGRNPGPRIWIEHVKAEVAAGKKAVAAPEKGVELLWRKLADGNTLTGGRTTDQEPIDPANCPPDTYYDSGRLITSEWGSTLAYSMYSPSANCNNCQTANAGCGRWRSRRSGMRVVIRSRPPIPSRPARSRTTIFH